MKNNFTKKDLLVDKGLMILILLICGAIVVMLVITAVMLNDL
ncbi:MAG: hypothetical protein V4649_01675 [Bacteroidota bacterium]